MAHTCEMFFFVKFFRKTSDAPTVDMMTTVVWNLGRSDDSGTAAAKGTMKELRVGLSESLGQAGSEKDIGIAVYQVTTPGATKASCLAMLKDPTFTFAKNALAITLQSVGVAVTNQPNTNPFCVPTP